jgi:pimeloyl-ACP methyl ester carboxylesterase
MPFVSHRGQRIHYTVEGSGPLVILQHGLFVDGESWRQAGFVAALSGRYRVACVDSLGHGQSDKPSAPILYAQEQRGGDIVAVADELGGKRFHMVGHSMGGWMAVGVAKYHPGRLASLTVGGWDVRRGLVSALPAGLAASLTFDLMTAYSRSSAPDLMAWVTPEVEPGLRACWHALGDLSGAQDAVVQARAPLLLWAGVRDPYHEPMQAFAGEHGLEFLSTSGDHMGAVLKHAPESAAGVGAFLDRAATR